jgi:hypothetical protein
MSPLQSVGLVCICVRDLQVRYLFLSKVAYVLDFKIYDHLPAGSEAQNLVRSASCFVFLKSAFFLKNPNIFSERGSFSGHPYENMT